MTAAHTPARDPRNWRTEHASLQATIDTRGELARRTSRARADLAPPPISTAGSREIPSWLLAVLFVLTVAALALFAPGAQASPINCQGDQEYYVAVTAESPWAASQWWTDCGYRYEVALPEPLVITPRLPDRSTILSAPISPVPEPAAWLMFAGGLICVVAVARRRKGQAS